jgi:hypothetical protein
MTAHGDTTRHKDGTVRHQFYGRYTLPCPGNPDHDWWEPLLTTIADTDIGFNGPSTSGVHNQTTVVLLAALAENARALRSWRDEADHQQRQREPAA